MDAREGQGPAGGHPGLTDLFAYPLMACLQDRRTRRVARGVSITAGDASHQSTNAPSPLSPLEEAVLIGSIGVTGAVMHDGPTDFGAQKELGSPFLNVVARAASSPDNAQATSFFMINDEAIWLIRRLKGREALDLANSVPPRWEDRSEDDWLAAAAAVKQKVHDGRMEFPRDWPYYLGWNRQHSNAPGTTVFLPVVDNTRQYINALLILASEPKGIAPLFIDDYRRFTPRGAMEWLAWAAMWVGLAPNIPYQPIGGVKRVRQGYFSKDNPITLNAVGSARTDHEAFLAMQNLLLAAEGLRLGGWVHSGILPPHIWKRDPSKGLLGLGFREHGPAKPGRFARWPPAPASQPNIVGLDGVLEGLCPPYVTDMDAAVDQVLDDKYGPGGVYGDKELFAQAYKDQAAADAYLRNQAPHPPEAVAYTKEICRYLYETYGRFPAHTDAFYLPGLWVQVSRLELEYYEKFANPAHFRRQAERPSVWGE
ncbi:MAG: hypothetical protein AB1673_03895 [Actinomycetota bacterium]